MRAISKSLRWGLPLCGVQDHLIALTLNTLCQQLTFAVSNGMYFLPKNKKMTADLYLQVLEDHKFNFYNIHGSEVFMHNSAPCHKARKVTKYLEQKQMNILEWPAQI